MITRFKIIIVLSIINSFFSKPINAQEKYPKTKNNARGFIENNGQILDQYRLRNEGIKFLLNRPGLNIQLRETGFSYDKWVFDTIQKSNSEAPLLSDHVQEKENGKRYRLHRVDVEFVGANEKLTIESKGRSEEYLIYYNEITGEKGIRAYYYERVLYKNVYKGIDIEFLASEGEEKTLKYNIILSPGADIDQVRLKYSGAVKTELVDNNLILELSNGIITETMPLSWSEPSMLKQDIRYKIASKAADGITIGFYGTTNEEKLIIDPLPKLSYGTYFGGSVEEGAYDIAVDSGNNIYIGGYSYSSSGIATSGSYQSVFGGGLSDVFLTKFDNRGKCIWSTYFGGAGFERCSTVVIDNQNRIYIAGVTSSSSGIASTGVYQDIYGGNQDGYLAKFNVDGILLWSTYLGGTMSERVNGAAIDENNNIYLTGEVTGGSSIVTPGTQQITFAGGSDAFVVKFSSGGVRLMGTFYGGSQNEYASSIAIDKGNNIIISGHTMSTSGITTTGVHQAGHGGGNYDGFLVKFGSNGKRLWATYLGGSDYDNISSMALDSSSNIYVGGLTASSNAISTMSSAQSLFGGNQDGFVVKFNNNGKRVWGRYIGESGYDNVSSMVLDSIGNLYIAGETTSLGSIATINAYQTFLNGPRDGFIIKIDSNSNTLWGTYYGSENNEDINRIALDKMGYIYLTGITNGRANISTKDAYQKTLNGSSNAILAKLNEKWPEIVIRGNNLEINSNDTFPSVNDSTDFGEQLTCKGTIKRKYKIFNTGLKQLYLNNPNSIIIRKSSGDFTIYQYPKDSVKENDSTFFIVEFDPSDTGIKSAEVIVNSNGINQKKCTFKIQGKGTEPAIDILSTNTIILNGDATPSVEDSTDFEKQNFCKGSLQHTFKIINTGNTDLGIDSLTITGINALDFNVVKSPFALVNPQATTTFTIKFKPLGLGTRRAKINIFNNSCKNKVYSFSVTGEGVDPEIMVFGNDIKINSNDITPSISDSTDFGSTCSNQLIRTFKIKNTGTSTLEISSIRILGQNMTEFSTVNLSKTIQAGDSINMTTMFFSKNPGIKRATITIKNNDCKNPDFVFEITATQNNPIRPDIGADRTICKDTIRLDAGSGFSSYNWYPGGRTTNFMDITKPGIYMVAVLDNNGCYGKDTVTVKEKCTENPIYIPTAFSPGANGINDQFRWYGSIEFKRYTIKIYNLWGEMLWQSDNPKESWDGNYKNKTVTDGTYIYFIYGVDTDGRKHRYNGSFSVLKN